MLSGGIGDEVNVNGNWGVIGQPGFGIPITVKLNGMYSNEFIVLWQYECTSDCYIRMF